MDAQQTKQDVQDDLSVCREVNASNSNVVSGYESLVQNQDDVNELSVLVSGVHCAGCIQKIESSLLNEKNIQNARLNFSTNRLNFSWNGTAENANDYVALVEKLGYGVQPYDSEAEQNESKNEERFLLLCLGVAGFAMGNIMLMSFGLWITSTETMGVATRDLMHWIQALIALPTVAFAGRPFFRSALKALSNGHTNMDVPISLALVLASGMSLFETFNHGEHVYFDSAVMLMFFLLIGRYLDFRARKQARSTATDLLSTLSGFASVIADGQPQKILIRDLKEEMIVRVGAGEKFPVDGQVIEGQTTVDTSLVTGETLPRDLNTGEEVYAGTLNMSAPVSVRVAKAADDSLLADIVRLMEKAGQGQAKYVRLADRAAKLYTPVVHTFAAISFLGWLLIGNLGWQDSLMIAVTVLIITCPCALGLAVPVVQVLATGRLMKQGVLVKSGDALERLSVIDTVMLDKTGTLTLGDLQLKSVHDAALLQLAASLATYSQHPLSVALCKAYDGDLLAISNVQDHPGMGLEGVYEGQKIRLGSRAWCGDQDQAETENIELWLDIEGDKKEVFSFEDTLRSDSIDIVSSLKDDGLDVLLVSGDRQSVVEDLAKQTGIDDFYAEKKPQQKFEILEDMKGNDKNVLMVGDGLNDAPVLAGANVSIAPGTAIDMAQNAADIVFMGDKFVPVYDTYKTAKMTQKLVKQNFTLAVLYNIVAVPLAVMGMVTPLIAAIAMSGSSLIVIANSFRLRFMS